MTKKAKRETIEMVNPRYQPSPAELQEDLRIRATPEQAARAVMRRVQVRQIHRPKPSSE